MTKEAREQEIDDYLAYLNQVAAHIMDVVERRRIPITVLGFSQGATTASRWVTLGRLPAERLILWAGPIAHDLDLDTHRSVLNALDIKFVVGHKDHFITPSLLEKEKKRLLDQRIEFTHIPFEGAHRMNADVLTQLANPNS